MPNYPIWISTDNHGTPKIGAHMRDAETETDAEQIYPSQMAHRVTARDDAGHVTICTPTEARQSGWIVLNTYPAAYGPAGRGR